MAADLKAKFFDQCRGDFFEDVLRCVVFAQELAVGIDRAWAQILAVARQVEGELHAGIEAPRVGGLVDGQIPELGEQEQAADRVKLLGGSAHGGVKVAGHLSGGQQLEQAAADKALHACLKPAKSVGAQLRVPPRADVGVEQEVL